MQVSNENKTHSRKNILTLIAKELIFVFSLSSNKLFFVYSSRYLTSLQACVIGGLNTCENPAPGNIIDSLFNKIKTNTSCDTLDKSSKLASSDVKSSAFSFLGSVSLISVTILLKFV